MRSWPVDNAFKKTRFGIHIFNPVPNSLKKKPDADIDKDWCRNLS